MKKKTGKRVGRQEQKPSTEELMKQLLLPMVVGVVSTRNDLMSWVHDRGLDAMDEVFRADAERLVGKKSKQQVDRVNHHWGKTWSEVPFGGQRIAVERPRVRSVNGRERQLPSLEVFRRIDPLPERVVDKILLGVSTRGYDRSIEHAPPGVSGRGSSKSAASRNLISLTRQKLQQDMGRKLDDVNLIAMMLDGLVIAKQTLVVALGITVDGNKVPLGLVQGSTENHTVCTKLLQDLIARGLQVRERILCVIDGGKGIHKALADVFGDLAVIQRCQVHKRRNVRDLISEAHLPYTMSAMSEAYKSHNAHVARNRLRQLISWLEANGEEDAAASLREGLEETLTVVKLGLPGTLRRSFSTTNAIENLMSAIRRVTRNVKRWQKDMPRRWTALAILHAAKRFRRIKGHKELPILINALRQQRKALDVAQGAA